MTATRTTRERLRDRIENDPDVETEAGILHPEAMTKDTPAELIERLWNVARSSIQGRAGQPEEHITGKAATALEALQAENLRLQATLVVCEQACWKEAQTADGLSRDVRRAVGESLSGKNPADALVIRADKAEAENERLRVALTPSPETKRAYWGEFETTDTHGNAVPVSWTTIKEIMAAIRFRAIP